MRATDDIDSYFAQSESKRYVVGPMIDISLPLGFGFEADALYRRTGFRTATGSFAGSYISGYRANTWEFPLLLKYRLPLPWIKPYVEVGYAPRRISGSYESIGYNVDLLTGKTTYNTGRADWKPDVGHGVVAGAGVEFGGRHLRIAPEFRYTNWSDDPINLYGSQGYLVNAAANQIDVLVGITWR